MKLAVVMIMLGVGVFSSTPVRANDNVTIVLDWFVNPDHAPIILAKEWGYFDQEGININILTPSNASDVGKLVASKRVTLGISYQPQLYLMAQAQLPVVRFASLVSTPLVAVIIPQDSDIKSLSMLSGRSVGYSVPGIHEIMLDTIVKHEKADPSSVKKVAVNMALSQSLLSGTVDATIGGFRNFEVYELQQQGMRVRVFPVEDHGVPSYDELVFITHKNNVGSCTGVRVLQKFINALVRANERIVSNISAAWRDFSDTSEDLDTSVNRSAFYDTVPRFAINPGAFDAYRYENFARFLRDQKMIKSLPKLSEYAVSLQYCQ